MKQIVGIVVLALSIFPGMIAVAKSTPTELWGTWDYTTMSALKGGKPFGIVHFQPGQWSVTFNMDGAWTMKTPSNINPLGLKGTYKVRRRDLHMNLSTGKEYQNYRFSLEQDGKAVVMTSKEEAITASRE